MADDGELLRRYATRGSEEAFAELVRRHVDLVHAAALRRTGDSHAAQDVVQLVFASLARQADRLHGRPELLSWLYTAVHFTAAKIRRSETRRDERQMKALEFHDASGAPARDPDWNRFRLVLDEAISDLGEKDRQAILTRFFQDSTYAEMGGSLGLTEDGARKRLDRAMEKLRAALARRGVTSTAAAIATTLSQPLGAAPAGLAAAAAANALTAARMAAIVGQTLTMTSLQKTLVTAAVAMAVGIAVFERQRATRLQSQVGDLQQSVSTARSREQQARREGRGLAPGTITEAEIAAGAQTAPAPAIPAPTGTPLERMRDWLARLEVSIPELRFLSADDWTQLSNKYPLDTETQARLALRSLRVTAKGRVGSMMQEALRAYAAANGGQFPTDISQLEPYFTPPIGADVLARYAMFKPEDGSSRGNPFPEDPVLVVEKPGSVVDPEFDVLASFSLAGTNIQVVGRTMDAYRAALQSYTQSTGGQRPTTLEQLLPHITSPVNPEHLQQIFYDTIVSRPASQGPGG